MMQELHPLPPTSTAQHDALRRELDELFSLSRRYRASREYLELLQFVSSFRSYSPFNALLIHIQMPGAHFVAPARRWLCVYGRLIRPGATPLVILQPMGPVMFVYDVSDTEPQKGAPPLPPEVERPFAVRRGHVRRGRLDLTIKNARRDGVEVTDQSAGSQAAGSIGPTTRPGTLTVQVRLHPQPEYVHVPRRYELLLNSAHSTEEKYATLVHELGHLYCGHLGTPDRRWWPDRLGIQQDLGEFEAESVSYLVCERLGVDTPAERYLGSYVRDSDNVPEISLGAIMTAAGLIERMGCKRLPTRERESRQKQRRLS